MQLNLFQLLTQSRLSMSADALIVSKIGKNYFTVLFIFLIINLKIFSTSFNSIFHLKKYANLTEKVLPLNLIRCQAVVHCPSPHHLRLSPSLSSSPSGKDFINAAITTGAS